MKFTFCLLALAAAIAPLRADEVDGSDVRRELLERDARVAKLSLDDQLKLRAASQKAVDDPAVKAALEKRNEAIRVYREAVRAAMIQADPSVAPLLERIAIPERPAAAAAEKP